MAKHEKRIAFVVPSFRGGGAERVTITLAEELDKFSDLNVTLIVLNSEGPLSEKQKNVDCVELNKSRARYAIFSLKDSLRSIDPDVVLGSLPQVNIILSLIELITTKSWKSVSILHNSYKKIRKVNSWIISLLFKKALKKTDFIVTVSKGLKNELIKNTKLSSNHIFSIYNPLDVDNIQRKSQQNINWNVITNQQNKVILGVGSLTKQKGFRYLISALPDIQKSYPEANIVILGKGPLKDKLKTLAKKLNVADCVHFPGFIDNPYKYMRAADIFVLPSLVEGFGLVLVEALACGTNIVSTDCPFGPREILKGGEFGKLVPPEDSNSMAKAIIKTLDSDSVDSKKLKSRANDFSKERIAKQYRKLILKLSS